MYISAKKYITNVLSDRRNKRFTINTLFNFITRFGVIGVNLLMVPLLLNVVGKERFGIWQTILVIISWSSLLNFGLGNGLRNLITKLITEKRHEEIGPAVGSALKVISKIVFFASIFLIPGIYFLLEPESLFSGNKIPESEVITAFSIFASFFLLNIVLGLSSSIAYGFQKSAIAGITNISHLLLCYLSILVAMQFTTLNLVDIAFIFGSLQSLVFLVSFFWQVQRFDIKIDLKDKYSLSSVYKLSGSFFAVQLLSILFFSIDNFVVSITLGANQTAEFSILSKIFYAIIGVFSVLLIQLWNSVTEAKIENNNKWIINIGKRLARFAFILFLGSLIISTFKDKLLYFWLGNELPNLTYTSFYLFSIYTLVHCLNAIVANIQNGIGELRLQMISIFISLAIYITGCLVLDVNKLGYNYLIVLKIIGTVVAIGINLLSVRNLRKQTRTWANES